jgi:hypothetical protein
VDDEPAAEDETPLAAQADAIGDETAPVESAPAESAEQAEAVDVETAEVDAETPPADEAKK